MTSIRPRPPPCRVLLVDQREQLEAATRSLFDSPVLTLSGPGCTYRSLLKEARAQRPDVVLLDLVPDDPDAFWAIEELMAEKPTPILALHPGGGGPDSFRALGLGVLDLNERPAAPTDAYWFEVGRQLTLLAQVRVVQHVRGKLRRRSPAVHEPGLPFPLVAIAASLGGPKALCTLLRMVPAQFPAPILICQHITAGFTEGLAQWLAAETALRVVEGSDGEQVAPGTVYIAPSGSHLRVAEQGKLVLDPGPALHGFRPSCDALLKSAAETFKSRAIGVVLTGMGRDGAQGLKEIRQRGGKTVAQDEASCVVFGMPREAIALGAAEEVLPLEQIAAALIRLVEQV